MLFDLRARGRRRTVQVVYLGLALLFLVGFVGFGVGVGGGSGGLIEGIFGSKEGSAGAGYAKQVAAAEARAHKHPDEAAAWAALVEARFHEASGSEFYNEEKLQFTEKGKNLLTKIVADWNRYVSLKPAAPTLTLGYDMIKTFGEEGLNEPADAVAALQLVIPTQPPSAALYGQLAKYAYQAKNTSVGDLAAQKTISLTPAKQRKQVEEQLKIIKAHPTSNGSSYSFTATNSATKGVTHPSGKTPAGGSSTATTKK